MAQGSTAINVKSSVICLVDSSDEELEGYSNNTDKPTSRNISNSSRDKICLRLATAVSLDQHEPTFSDEEDPHPLPLRLSNHSSNSDKYNFELKEVSTLISGAGRLGNCSSNVSVPNEPPLEFRKTANRSISLSSSDESTHDEPPLESKKTATGSISLSSSSNDDSSDDFEQEGRNFAKRAGVQDVAKIGNLNLEGQDFDFPEVPFNYIPTRRKPPSTGSEVKSTSNSCYSSKKKSGETAEEIDKSEGKPEETRKPRKEKASKQPDPAKEREKEERLKRKEEKARTKAMKQSTALNLKNIQPGECLKFIRVLIAEELQSTPFYPDIYTTLSSLNIDCEPTPRVLPFSIGWERILEENYVDDRNEIKKRRETRVENWTMIVWTQEQVLKEVERDTFGVTIRSYRDVVPGGRLTLVLYGMKQYFKRCGRGNSRVALSEDDLECLLVEIQLSCNCGSKLVDTPQELGLFIYQYTKAIAEVPYKLEKRSKESARLEWYAMGDNKDTVKIDKDGNGLKRLWQQQLCQFTLVGLEIAEAICKEYPSPVKLMEAYRSCTVEEGKKLLQDIPVRRAAGILTAVRKVGPELSKKMYLMFTSVDGEAILGDS